MRRADKLRLGHLSNIDDQLEDLIDKDAEHKIHQGTGHRLFGICATQIVCHIIADLMERYSPRGYRWL